MQDRGVNPSRPTAPPRPTSPEAPKPRTYSDLGMAEQLLVQNTIRPAWERAVARYAERKRREAEASAVEHVRAA